MGRRRERKIVFELQSFYQYATEKQLQEYIFFICFLFLFLLLLLVVPSSLLDSVFRRLKKIVQTLLHMSGRTWLMNERMPRRIEHMINTFRWFSLLFFFSFSLRLRSCCLLFKLERMYATGQAVVRGRKAINYIYYCYSYCYRLPHLFGKFIFNAFKEHRNRQKQQNQIGNRYSIKIMSFFVPLKIW